MSASTPPSATSTVVWLTDYRAATEPAHRVRVAHDEPAPLFAHALVTGFVTSHGPAGQVSLRAGRGSNGVTPPVPVRHLRSVGRLTR